MHDASLAPVFFELALLVLMAAGLGLLGLLLRQPLVVTFIAAGILAGPDVLGLVHSSELIDLLGQIAVAVLLFLVGLKLDVGLIRSLGAAAVLAGVGQMALSTLAGAGLCLILGFDPGTALALGLALGFSSTIIVVKMLSDRREIDALHGRLALGILIVQDVAVVAAMVALAAVGGAGHPASPLTLVAGAVGLLALVWVFVRYLAEPLMARIARAPDLVVIFAVGWAAGFAAVADTFGLGQELGGLVAGVSLASTPFRDAIGARLAPLRDFLLLFFFLGLGAGLELAGLWAQFWPALALALLVLVGKPLIVAGLLRVMGYRARTGFLAGITLGQVSEFSLIFAAMAMGSGLLGPEAVALVTLVAMLSIALSVYAIGASHRLFALFEPILTRLDRGAGRESESDSPERPREGPQIVVLGLGRYGQRIGRALQARGHRLLGVDFDPEAIRAWRALGLEAHYGDATDPELVAHLPLAGVRAVISAVPPSRGALSEAEVNPALLHALRAAGFRGTVALTLASRDDPAAAAAGVLALSPFEDAAERAAERIDAACHEGRC